MARPPATAAASSGAVTSSKRGGSAQAPGMIPLLLSQLTTVQSAKSIIFYYVVYKYASKLLRHLRVYGVTSSLYQLYTAISRTVLTLILRTPAARRRVERDLGKAMKDVEAKLIPPTPHLSQNLELPSYGKSNDWLLQELRKLQQLEVGGSEPVGFENWEARNGESVWRSGKISGAVYHGGQEMSDMLADAIKMFMLTNPLHPDVFPGVRKMEAEVISMVLRMYNAPDGAAGSTTSGGTESILMACRTMREWGKATKGITEPEMIVPASAHAAFFKAGDYFGIKVHQVPVDPVTRKVLLPKVRRAINKNTIMIVGSAPNFPDGIIDPIPALASMAKRANVGLHVDCCLGSFLVPFLERAGLPSEPFDFRVDGVTSISCDTHKYGFAPKGSSVVMYRSAELRRHQYYVQADWSGGVYASPTIAGSRPGSLIAGTWAALMAMGEDGYTQSCREIVGAARTIEKRIREEIKDLRIMGRPLVSVVAFHSAGKVNIYEVGDGMSKKGWHLNALATEPTGIHIACTRLTVPVVDTFIADLKATVSEVKKMKKGGPQGNMTALYGLGSSSAVGPALVGELSSRFLDTLTKT
ncbi:Dihydrosphingosine phosphate lyase [Tilletia horrida]|nr:Dihydrosphingosine phosphate lyase [Tilletia horrida]